MFETVSYFSTQIAEFTSYIGGLLSMWLGFSLFGFYNLIERTLVRLWMFIKEKRSNRNNNRDNKNIPTIKVSKNNEETTKKEDPIVKVWTSEDADNFVNDDHQNRSNEDYEDDDEYGEEEGGRGEEDDGDGDFEDDETSPDLSRHTGRSYRNYRNFHGRNYDLQHSNQSENLRNSSLRSSEMNRRSPMPPLPPNHGLRTGIRWTENKSNERSQLRKSNQGNRFEHSQMSSFHNHRSNVSITSDEQEYYDTKHYPNKLRHDFYRYAQPPTPIDWTPLIRRHRLR